MTVSQDDVLEIVVEGDFQNSEQLLNIYQMQAFQASPITDDEALTDLVDFFRALYDAAKALWTAFVVFRRIRVTNLTTGLVTGEAAFSSPVIGTASGDPLPPGVAALVNFTTAVPNVQLRKFLPAPAESAGGTDGQWNSTTITALTVFGATMLIDYVGTFGGFRYGYLSPKTSSFVLPNGAIIPDEPAYQRRRKRGVGS